MVQSNVLKRDVAIDLVKVIATLLVLNSHMGICYGSYSALATGGGIGDALFFFVSGYTLFLGRKLDFLNWYKRRISRIYPTVIAVGLLACLIFGQELSFIDVMAVRKYWFLQCILLAYILLYPIWRYEWSLYKCLTVSILLFTCSYFLFFDFNGGLFYGVDNFFRWIFYFSFMILGGVFCKQSKNIRFQKISIVMLPVCVLSWYAINYLAMGTGFVLLSYIPLVGICFYLYQLCKADVVARIFEHRIWGNVLFIIGNLCLESYLIQKMVFTDALNNLFPINIPIIMLAVIVLAYIVHFVSQLIAQIFDSKPLDWKSCLLYKKS